MVVKLSVFVMKNSTGVQGWQERGAERETRSISGWARLNLTRHQFRYSPHNWARQVTGAGARKWRQQEGFSYWQPVGLRGKEKANERREEWKGWERDRCGEREEEKTKENQARRRRWRSQWMSSNGTRCMNFVCNQVSVCAFLHSVQRVLKGVPSDHCSLHFVASLQQSFARENFENHLDN